MPVCDSGSEILFMKISYIESVHDMTYASSVIRENKLPCITHVCDIGIKVIFMKINYLIILYYIL